MDGKAPARAGRDWAGLDKLQDQDECDSFDQKCRYCGDLMDQTFCDILPAEIVKTHGKLDILVNNAGIKPEERSRKQVMRISFYDGDQCRGPFAYAVQQLGLWRTQGVVRLSIPQAAGGSIPGRIIRFMSCQNQ